MVRTRVIAKIKTGDIIGFTGDRNVYTVCGIVPATGNGFGNHLDITLRNVVTGSTDIRRLHRFFGVEIRYI